MKNILYIISAVFFFSTTALNAQVGINTDAPKAMLDVRGNLTIQDKIYAGGSDTELGDPGKKGQVLVSQGENNPPAWKSLNVPNIKAGEFYVIFTDSYSDLIGQIFFSSDNINGNPLYEENDLRTDSKFNDWKDISGLTQSFSVYNTDHKVNVTFEAIVQLSGSGSGSVDFACGIFINNQLKGVRVETIKQASSSHAFNTFLMSVIAENVNIGENEAKISCARIRSNGYSGSIGIGRSIEDNINNFVAQSSLRIDVYEIPENFIPVVY